MALCSFASPHPKLCLAPAALVKQVVVHQHVAARRRLVAAGWVCSRQAGRLGRLAAQLPASQCQCRAAVPSAVQRRPQWQQAGRPLTDDEQVKHAVAASHVLLGGGGALRAAVD